MLYGLPPAENDGSRIRRWFYPVILSGFHSPPMRIIKCPLRYFAAKVSQRFDLSKKSCIFVHCYFSYKDMTKAGILTRIAQQTGLQNDDPASFGFPLWNRAIFLHIPLYGTDRQSHSINHNLPDKPLHVLPFRHSLQEYIHFYYCSYDTTYHFDYK